MDSIEDLPDLLHITSRKEFYRSNDTIIVKLPSELAIGQPMFQMASLNIGNKNDRSEWPVNQFMNEISSQQYENIPSGSNNVVMRNNFPAPHAHNKVPHLLPTPNMPPVKQHFNQQPPSFQEYRPQKRNNWVRKRGSNTRFRDRSHNRTFRGRGRNRDFRRTIESSQPRNNFETNFPPNVPEFNTTAKNFQPPSQIPFQAYQYYDSYTASNERQHRF